uniref:Uncharacterized protein n=1 Tax=Panagrolaimus davidi TaxID=227884 RepID=A0A914PYA9_9BILA
MEKWYDEGFEDDEDMNEEDEGFEDEDEDEGFDEDMDSNCESEDEDDMEEEKVSRNKKPKTELSQMIQFMHGNSMIHWLHEDHWKNMGKEEEEKENMDKEDLSIN